MATKINKKNLLALCSPQKNVTAKKVDKAKKTFSNEEAFEYVKNNYSENVNVLAKELGITAKKAAGLKRSVTCRQNKAKVAFVLASKKAADKKPAFSNYYGVKKQITRDMFADLIKKSGKLEGKVGGLSAGKCLSERTINEKIPSNKFLFEGYEIEVDTCKEMQQTILENKLNMFAIPLSIGVPINNAKKDEYAHFNLDFCVNFTSIEDYIATFFSRDIMQVDGIGQITIGTRYSKSRFVDEFGDKGCNTKKNLNAFCNFLKNFPNYKVVAFNSYKEGKDGMPMLAIFVKRIK